jgi:hypothetical protein
MVEAKSDLPLEIEGDGVWSPAARVSLHQAPVLLDIIDAHRNLLGHDYEAYLGHALRVRALAL